MKKIVLLRCLTMGYLISVNIVMLITFFYAFFQPEGSLIVSVNALGEGLTEAIFLIAFNILNIFGIMSISRIIRLPGGLKDYANK